MTLDPQVEEAFRPLPSEPPIWELPVSEARRRERGIHAALNPSPRRLFQATTIEIAGPGGPIPCEVLVPRRSEAPLPVVLYFHGGGCVLLDPEAYRPITSAIAEDADCIVVVPRYRLAPEHPFPAAVEDAFAVYLWALAESADLGADPGLVALCGDSAGGYLSAAVTLECARGGIPQPRCQALVYPCTDMTTDWPSYHQDGVGDTLREINWLTGLYGGEGGAVAVDWPLRAESHRGLAPAFILAAEVDPLLDQGRAYARKLRECGVPVTEVVYGAMPHGFLSMGGRVDAGAQALAQLSDVLRRALRMRSPSSD